MRNKFWASVTLAIGIVLGGGFSAAPAQAVSVSPGVVVGSITTPTGEQVRTGGNPAGKVGKKGYAATEKQKGKNQALLSSTFRYAGYHQAYNADGAKANVDVVSVGTLDSGDHSLVELTVEREAGAGVIDAVEIGFNVDPALYGNSNPHLFVYSWENSVPQGYNGSNGYTDIVDTCGSGGTNVVAGQTETAGTNVSLTWLYGGSPTGWYAYRANCAFGYYPASAWAGTTFTSATTTYNQGFWELYDSDGSATPCSDMGNGTLASTAPAGANMGSYLLGTAPASAVNMVGFTQNVISSSYYAQAKLSARTQRGGGPGAC